MCTCGGVDLSWLLSTDSEEERGDGVDRNGSVGDLSRLSLIWEGPGSAI